VEKKNPDFEQQLLEKTGKHHKYKVPSMTWLFKKIFKYPEMIKFF